MRLILHNFLFLLKRFRISSILNIIGLSIAFAVFFVIVVQVYYDFRFDRNFEKANNIYTTSLNNSNQGNIRMPVTGIEQFPEVRNFCYLKGNPDNIQKFDVEDNNGNKHEFREIAVYTNERFIDVFTPKIIIGDARQALSTEGKAMLMESVAKKFFGSDDPLGQVFYFRDQNTPITVTAICEDFPDNCSLKNGIYLPQRESEFYPDKFIYLEISRGGKDKILNALNKTVEQNGNSARWELTALPDLHLKFPAQGQISRATTLSLLAIGILLMIISYINFVNFSMSMAPVRLKGFNIRRIFGENPVFLKFSIIMEVVLMSFIAFLISICIFGLISTSIIKAFFQADLSLSKNLTPLILVGIASFVMGFLAGIYPAFYSTHFTPMMALSGSFTASSGSKLLKNILIVIQFIAAVFLVITAAFIKMQHNYMQKKSWGVQKENILFINQVHAKLSQNVQIFETELKKNPDIFDVTYSSFLTGDDMPVIGNELDDKSVHFFIWIVNPNFFRFFGVDIIEGRDFRDDENNKYILNRTFLEQYGLTFDKDVSGREMWGQGSGGKAEIIGIANDFNFQPLYEPVKPIAFLNKVWIPIYMFVKINGQNAQNTVKYINETWTKFSKEPTDIVFLEKWLDDLYIQENNLSKLISIFGLITIIVTVMGVYGLILFNAKSKRKTIALHKVHGATIMEVILMLNRGFLIQFAVAYIIAVPVAYYAVNRWLENFAYKTPIHWW
ncbi:MAG: ABC transporter permease, partial [Bacteroidales bacterium]|nr:ABC transporter permease [Bacteroidales bacterium]